MLPEAKLGREQLLGVPIRPALPRLSQSVSLCVFIWKPVVRRDWELEVPSDIKQREGRGSREGL